MNEVIVIHRFSRAIVRQPAPTLGDGLTTACLVAPDLDLAQRQFDFYVQALEACGLTVMILPPLSAHPDAHFVEDTAVMVGDSAVITRPGAPTRRGEAEAMAPMLAAHGVVRRIEAPGTLDGGDVLIAGDVAFIGLSARTNIAGSDQLGGVLESHGLSWRTVPVGAGLHFKSSVNVVGDGVLLVTQEFAGREELAGFTTVAVPVGDEYACNTLLLNDRLLMPAGYPATRRLLEPLGRDIIELDTSEFRKMDGGLTCLSLRF